MAGIFKRGNKWWAMWYEGSEKRRKATGIDVHPKTGKAAANKAAAMQIAEAYERAGKGQASAEAIATALYAAADAIGKRDLVTAREFLTSYRPAGLPQSQANAYRAVNLFLDFLTARKLDVFALADIKRKHCEEFLGERLQEVAEGTVKSCRAKLTAAFNKAIKDELITTNPFSLVSMPDVVNRYSPETKGKDKTERELFTPAELQTILFLLPRPYCDLAAVSYYTAGQRLNDCVNLTWEQVDFEGGFIRFCTQKTAKRLALPLMPELRRRLEARRKLTTDKGNPYVFPELAMQAARSRGVISVQFGMLLKSYGIVQEQPAVAKKGKRRNVATKSFHSIRHTVVSFMRAGGVPADVSRSVVGHDSEAVERIYFKATADSQMNALSVLADAIQPPTA